MTIKDSVLRMQRASRLRDRVTAVLLLLFAIAPLARAVDNAADTLRTSTTQAGPVADVAGTSPTITDVFAPLVQFGYRGSNAAQTTVRTQPAIVSAFPTYRIYSAVTDLLLDDNNDSYFQRFRITFDADVDSGSADVYAQLYLSLYGGPWNLYYKTNNITLNGATRGDEYAVVTTLSNGYPHGSYDVLIELYDAYSGALLTHAGPDNFAALNALPLEDQAYDSPYYPGPSAGDGGGGALSIVEGMLLVLLLAWRRTPLGRDA